MKFEDQLIKMAVDEEGVMMMKKKKKRNLLVGIRIDSQSKEILNWVLAKIAEPGDCVIAAHICRNSERELKDKPLLDGYLGEFESLCNSKQVNLSGKILTGNSIRRVLVKEAKNCDAVNVIVGISSPISLGSWATVARHCAKHLPISTDVVAIHNGKIVFRRFSNNPLPAFEGDSRPSMKKSQSSEYGDSEAESECSSLEAFHSSKSRLKTCSADLSVNHSLSNSRSKAAKRSLSLLDGDPSKQGPGWPLLGRTISSTALMPPKSMGPRTLSVVQWVMSLPDRSPPQTPQISSETEHFSGVEIGDFLSRSSDKSIPFSRSELIKELELLLLKTNSSVCRLFSYEVLKAATSQFSAENLIGNGGCNSVYKGRLSDGKQVAVKILKSSKEAAWNDFALEFEILSSLKKHKHIKPLLGICFEENNLITVYDYLSKGSLEKNLHDTQRDKNVLSWEARFKIAVGVAEALSYLHDECSRPVIHRDVKSSNILLSDGLEPQLSDFGLAIWGPTTSSFLTQVDVVGTFGYLAPEYFMYGKVSDKVDVYSFGVVLLELLSGRKPICSEIHKGGQESLVIWAKPKIESGDLKGILDPDLEDGNVDEVQVQRMVLASTLCITRSARLRPRMSEILKLLRGEKDVEKWVSDFQIDGQSDLGAKQDDDDDNDDEVYPSSCAESHLSLALLDVNEDSTSLSSVDQSNNSLSIEEYLKGRYSRSSSID